MFPCSVSDCRSRACMIMFDVSQAADTADPLDRTRRWSPLCVLRVSSTSVCTFVVIPPQAQATALPRSLALEVAAAHVLLCTRNRLCSCSW
jgi:hypothetical protein